MALMTPFFITLFLLSSSLSSAAAQMPTSTISAAPALLPTLSPSYSPDISPLFPSPGPASNGLSPTESTLPIIPSSPSPPNPDDMAAAEGPTMAFSPFGSSSNGHIDSSSHSLTPLMVALVLLPFWVLQLVHTST